MYCAWVLAVLAQMENEVLDMRMEVGLANWNPGRAAHDLTGSTNE